MKKTAVLPTDLKLDQNQNLQLFDYRVSSNILKSKIILSKNAISFLIEGNKKVLGSDKNVQIDNSHFLIMCTGNCLMTEKVSESHKLYRSILLFFTDKEALSFLQKHNRISTKK